MCCKDAEDETWLNLRSCFPSGAAGVCPWSILVFGIWVAHALLWLCRGSRTFLSRSLLLSVPRKHSDTTPITRRLRVWWWGLCDGCRLRLQSVWYVLRRRSGRDNITLSLGSGLWYQGLMGTLMLRRWPLTFRITSEVSLLLDVDFWRLWNLSCHEMSLICRVPDEMTHVMSWI